MSAGPSDDDLLALLSSSFDWARNGEVTRLAQLFDAGAPVNLTNDRGDTLLILAAYHRQDDVVRLLLDRGADVHRVNDNGQTALAAAVFRQSGDLVQLLLAAGADAEEGERSARDVAAFFGLTELAALLPDPAG